MKRIILALGACVVLVMVLFPPWVSSGGPPGTSRAVGFYFITHTGYEQINTTQLFTQILAVAAISFLLSMAFSRKT